ncbi:MAG TPA: tRNA adenosine(34) deaminase TadA [Actinomycetota bacterium]|jgi:tRNA(adenine34) deaminase|nr:tRNA adenosine(34) deaminase TadA [Actinomycetota bacterium]
MALERAVPSNEADDVGFMRLALAEANLAPAHDDVPIGAIAVAGGTVVGSAHNERERRSDPTAHAEVLALRAAAGHLGRWRLHDVTVYSTVEPCPMCAGALVAARVFRVVYGAPDEKAGAAYSLYNIVQDPRLNHECRLTTGVLAEDCAAVIQEFFRARRGRVESL